MLYIYVWELGFLSVVNGNTRFYGELFLSVISGERSVYLNRYDKTFLFFNELVLL